MSENSKIEWTESTWNPIRGCDETSPGCANCYAAAQAYRFSGPGQPYEGLVKKLPNGKVVWTGEFREAPNRLEEPLRWKRPRRIFVNSMSDLFGEGVSDEYIKRCFDVMERADWHAYQVLTKRADRMADFTARHGVPDHVWMGVSVEDQTRADQRIPELLKVPARVRWLSMEPLLGPVDLYAVPRPDVPYFQWRGETGAIGPKSEPDDFVWEQKSRLHWVVIGGESGPGARPCDLAWIRDIVRQCREAGAPCFVKQLGAKPVGLGSPSGWPIETQFDLRTGVKFRDPKGGDPSEWPEDLRVREYPGKETAK